MHKYDWEFLEFAKQYVIPTQCQEEDRPDITQAEAAGADKPHTVDRWECTVQPVSLKPSEKLREIQSNMRRNVIWRLDYCFGCGLSVFLGTYFSLDCLKTNLESV